MIMERIVLSIFTAVGGGVYGGIGGPEFCERILKIVPDQNAAYTMMITGLIVGGVAGIWITHDH